MNYKRKNNFSKFCILINFLFLFYCGILSIEYYQNSCVNVGDNTENLKHKLASVSHVIFLLSLLLGFVTLFHCSELKYGFNLLVKRFWFKKILRYNLTIIKATYGTAGTPKQLDVTEDLKKNIKDNFLTIYSSSDIKGDPDPGSMKTLVVKYKWGNSLLGNAEKNVIISEGETKTIPEE